MAGPLYGSQKAVSAAWKSLDINGGIGRLSQAVAKSLDGGVEGVVKIDKGIFGPELPAKLFARDQFTGPRNECDQNLKGLLLKIDFRAVFAKFTGAHIHFEGAKTKNTSLVHGSPANYRGV